MEPNELTKKKNSKIGKFLQLLKPNFMRKKSEKSLISTTSSFESNLVLKKKESKKKTDKKKQVQLPKNYAEDLLNLELELEEITPPNLSTVKKLLELYIIGVEYYELVHSQRYLIFKNKINALMAKPQILELLNQEESTGKIEKTIDSERALVMKNEKKKMLDLHIYLSSKQGDETNEEKAKILMNFHESNVKTMSNIVTKEIDYQKQSILSRLEERKRAISFIVPTSGDQDIIEEEKSEDYKKNSLHLLKVSSKEIGSLVNKMNLRNSLRKSQTLKNDNTENDEEVQKIYNKYEKELLELRQNLKEKNKSLLISKMIQKIEKERDTAIEAIRNQHN